MISCTFSFLEKLLFPILKEEMIIDSEDAIEGVNENLDMLIENMEDVTASSSIDRAYISAQALSDLTQAIYDCFFENEQELYDYEVLNILTTSFLASNQLDFGNLNQEHMMSNSYKDDNDPDWNKLPIPYYKKLLINKRFFSATLRIVLNYYLCHAFGFQIISGIKREYGVNP